MRKLGLKSILLSSVLMMGAYLFGAECKNKKEHCEESRRRLELSTKHLILRAVAGANPDMFEYKESWGCFYVTHGKNSRYKVESVFEKASDTSTPRLKEWRVLKTLSSEKETTDLGVVITVKELDFAKNLNESKKWGTPEQRMALRQIMTNAGYSSEVNLEISPYSECFNPKSARLSDLEKNRILSYILEKPDEFAQFTWFEFGKTNPKWVGAR
ncbi:hypothetical protein ACFLY6_02305 [Candidatus Dependentiae bacterium]